MKKQGAVREKSKRELLLEQAERAQNANRLTPFQNGVISELRRLVKKNGPGHLESLSASELKRLTSYAEKAPKARAGSMTGKPITVERIPFNIKKESHKWIKDWTEKGVDRKRNNFINEAIDEKIARMKL